jgi:hypothetical protein
MDDRQFDQHVWNWAVGCHIGARLDKEGLAAPESSEDVISCRSIARYRGWQPDAIHDDLMGKAGHA